MRHKGLQWTQFAEEQSAPAFKLDKTEVEPGEWVTYETKGLRQGSEYRLEVCAPVDAEFLPRQSKVGDFVGRGKDSASTGRAAIVAIPCREELFCADARREPKRTLQFPYNDKPGRYTVKLVDLATGLAAAQTVTVAEIAKP